MSTGQHSASDAPERTHTRDRTPSPARTIPSSVRAGGTTPLVPSSAESAGPGAEQQDIRPLIEPRADGFVGSTRCVREITSIFHRWFDGPYTSYGDVPIHVRDMWFDEFSKLFRWTEAHSTKIRSNWEHKCRTRLSDTLHKLRRTTVEGQCPSWIRPEHWEAMRQHWSKEEFQRVSSAARRNRGQATVTHTGGSVSFTEHLDRTRQQHGASFSRLDLFKRLHTFQTGDRQGQYVSERSRKMMEDVTTAKESFTQASSSGSVSATSPAVPDEQTLIIQAAGGYNRGRVFGLGSEAVRAREQLDQGFLRSSESSPQPDVAHLVQEQVEIITQRLQEDFDRRVGEIRDSFSQRDGAYAEWLTELSEKVGVAPRSMPPIGVRDEALESTEDTFVPPPDPHPSVHPRPRSPPPPPSAGAAAPVV